MAEGDRIAWSSVDTSGLRVSRHKLIQIGPAFLMQWPGCPRNESTAVFSCECGGHEVYKVRDVYRGHSRRCFGCKPNIAAKRKIGKLADTSKPVPKRRPRYGRYGEAKAARRTPLTRVNGKKRPEYYVWVFMKSRCYNPKSTAYKHYGGRGISVCDRWRNSFANFIADMGERPSDQHSIDRIDNDGNYEPSNCRWATDQVQANNKRTTAKVNGKTIAELSRSTGIAGSTLRERMKMGWSYERIVSTPVANRGQKSA